LHLSIQTSHLCAFQSATRNCLLQNVSFSSGWLSVTTSIRITTSLGIHLYVKPANHHIILVFSHFHSFSRYCITMLPLAQRCHPRHSCCLRRSVRCFDSPGVDAAANHR
jgi:hypothetical protein